MHSTSRYADRFSADTYRNDEPVELRCGAAAAVVLPERLFARAQNVARAYDLHLLPVIDVYSTTRLNRLQCATLLDEIAMIEGMLKDPLLVQHLAQIRGLLATCVGLPEGELVIQGP
jgi:hypothetical protein